MKQKYNIVIDLSIFIYANYYIVKKFADVIDVEKFCKKLDSQIKNEIHKISRFYPIKDIVLCVDSDSFRHNITNTYKGTREFNQEISDLKKSVVNEFTHIYDYSILKIDQLEADDLLFLYSRKHKNTIIVSNDNDCKLMLNQDTLFYKYQTNQWFTYVEEYSKFDKAEKVLFGCSGDNIERIAPKGKGHKWLKKILNTHVDRNLSYIYHQICSEYSISAEDLLRNIELTNYNIATYEKYVENFDKKYQLI